jgi:transcription initiation factor TFIID TATA-box-binding protein
MTRIKIENIVAYAQTAELLDIELLSEKFPGSSYNPAEFEGLSVKYDEDKIAVIVLGNGKIICTGAKTLEDATDKIKKVSNKIKKTGFELKKDYDINIENVIVSTDFNKELRLSSIADGLLLQNVDYHPEDFPGLIYRMGSPNAVILLFSSGKLVCTGVKSIEDATNAVKMMEEKLSSIGAL